MRRFFAGGVALFLACGCGQGPVASPAAAAARSHPQAEIRKAAFIGEAHAAKAPTPEKRIRWEVKTVQLPEHSIEQHGLARLFAGVAETNGDIAAELQRSALSDLARRDSNIILRANTSVYAGICGMVAASNLLDRLTRSAGVEVMTSPRATTLGTQEAQLFVGDSLHVITGASGTSSRVPFMTNLWFGHTITLQLLGATDEGLDVRAVARDERFGGYGRDEKKGDDGIIGTPPIFNLTVVATRAQLQTNEVLLLGSPPAFSVQKTVERVPKISNVPALGRLFTKVTMQTNFYRTVTFIQPIQD